MRLVVLFFASTISASVSLAAYEPFSFQCVYDASADGMITATTDIRPDTADFTVYLKSDQKQDTEKVEAEDVFVYTTDEIPAANLAAIEKLAQQQKLEWSSIFTVTEVRIVISPEATMTFYKFNANDGDLGVGVHSDVFGNSYYMACVLVK